jgi:hypothetical protein
MKKLFFITISFMLFCSTVFAGGIERDTAKHDSISVRDGSSFKKAIIITDSTEGAGIKAEYNWLAINYPGYTTNSQSLSMNEKRPYDILFITTKDGAKKEVYFDISNYFGKW